MKRLGVVVVGLVVLLVGALLVRRVVADDDGPPLVVVHWANSHPMREGLLPDMAARFNDEDHETASGRRIEVVVVPCDSDVQVDDLLDRVKGIAPDEEHCEIHLSAPAPTIVTPQSDDWLVKLNQDAGRPVVDPAAAPSIAETYLGIVTYRTIAECLGWPERALGYADILALSADPKGWETYDCARTEWGRRPLLAFTNPSTSTSGRNVLVSLYAIAAHKSLAELTVADVERPDVVHYVEEFQQLVEHYLPGTLQLNTKIHQGPRYGQFFLMPEDNLVSLAEGREQAIGLDGTITPVAANDDLVMIYPKEGSTLNSHPAAIVDAPWVTPEHVAAAGAWISYLRDGAQQQGFMDAGFRPATGTGLSVDPQRFTSWGLEAPTPPATIDPGSLRPEVLDKIIGSWGAVKDPAIVTFVVDTSGSMEGNKLWEVQRGLNRLLDTIAESDTQGSDNQVGLITFASRVETEMAPRPLGEARFEIGDAIDAMEAEGGTALFDAIRAGVTLTDDADVDGERDATRAVVVLSDGAATTGGCLDELISMTTVDEDEVTAFCGQEDQTPRTASGVVSVEQLRGASLRMDTEHDVQIFFLGFGAADLHVGRLLAQATDAEYQGSPDAELAAVIEDLGGYF